MSDAYAGGLCGTSLRLYQPVVSATGGTFVQLGRRPGNQQHSPAATGGVVGGLEEVLGRFPGNTPACTVFDCGIAPFWVASMVCAPHLGFPLPCSLPVASDFFFEMAKAGSPGR